MAYAAALFADSCLRGLNGTPTIECTYVDSNVTDAPYFASKCKLSTEGGCGRSGMGDARCTSCGSQAEATAAVIQGAMAMPVWPSSGTHPCLGTDHLLATARQCAGRAIDSTRCRQ